MIDRLISEFEYKLCKFFIFYCNDSDMSFKFMLTFTDSIKPMIHYDYSDLLPHIRIVNVFILAPLNFFFLNLFFKGQLSL